jgi:hypothetical protein
MAAISTWLRDFGGWPEVERYLNQPIPYGQSELLFEAREKGMEYGDEDGDVSF